MFSIKNILSALFAVVVMMLVPLRGQSFSILAHEAIIDAEWDLTLKKILLKKYPDATLDDLIKAHSYAYGGSLVLDIGYMPGGNAYFTDLMHYVRSGDFITNLLHEEHSLNEYAFALGALSHYIADQYGHSMATNVTVPELYPKLKAKFGNVVTYDEDHLSHSRMEFAYDVVQVGRSNYASVAYHDFIGFNIAKEPLQRAFLKTYGQDLSSLFKNFESSVSIMRWGVKNLFPAMTRQAWKSKRDEIVKVNTKATKRTFRYKMSSRMYRTEFGSDGSSKPDFKARALAFLIRILPKIGPLKTLKFVYPGQQGEKRFVSVFDTIIRKYGTALQTWDQQGLLLTDINLDTGHPQKFGEYKLSDKSYCELLCKLQKEQFMYMDKELQQHLITHFEDAEGLHQLFKDHPEDIAGVQQAIAQLRTFNVQENKIKNTTGSSATD
ncbi:zinc dependent phospholipase C family protein [Mucilaginibacter sp. CSA2-8R]|uniref:zinc dependent phospholipase C family protein n=1 Tax=Mucilaginibacter sp. CSA2-8R TaxID=3141542 RepID=UPI00315CA266